MNRTATTGSGLGALVLLLWMRGFHLAIPAPLVLGGAEASRTATQIGDTSSQRIDGPWRASQEFFAGQKTECPGNLVTATPRREKWCIPDSEPVRALIAIVPDPVRTRIALGFDRALEAIQLAAEHAGYVMDRYWLPWRVPVASVGVSQKSDLGTVSAEQRMSEPGVLMFRRNAGPQSSDPSVLFVFLAADISTAGIDGAQLTKAVSYVDEVMCQGASTCSADQPIRVTGPSFSGSLASLRRFADANRSRRFIAYSGSISSLCAMAEQGLVDEWPRADCANEPKDYVNRMKAPNVTFRTFVHPAESAVKEFVRTIYPHSGDCLRPKIAILSETATTFGGVVRSEPTGQAAPRDPDFGGCIASFAFPREIASLRNARRAEATPAQGSAQVPSAKMPFLSLDLTDRTNSSDAPPDYSPQGPASKEAVLMNIAAGLRRGHYRYVGLIGSNVLDVLFLTDFLRAVFPDSRLFTIGGDLLFERQFDNAPYVGTLTLTTYPLTDRTLTRKGSVWGEAVPQLPVSDGYEQGWYEASLQTIDELLSESRAKGVQTALGSAKVSNSPPTSPTDLPLWMMVVGNGGYWPVRLLHGTSVEQRQLSLSPTDFAGSWHLLLIVVTVLVALQIAVLLTTSPFAPQFRDFASVTAAPVQRLFFIQVGCATLAFGLALLLMPAWRYATPWHWPELFGTIALAAVCAVAFLIETSSYLRWCWKHAVDAAAHDAAYRTGRFQLLAFLLVWGAALTAGYVWWSLLGTDSTHLYGFLLAYRAVHPLSGVSPITPMIPLLVAVYAWTLFEVWRLRFNDTMRPRLFTSEALLAPEARQKRTERNYPGINTEEPIANAIKAYWLKGGYVALFVAAFIVWLSSLHPTDPFVLFDGRSFAKLYGVLFCLVVALMLSAGLRMMQIWASLRLLLAELDRSPVRKTFVRLKERSWSFWRQGGEAAEWAYMARSLEAADRLRCVGSLVSAEDLPGAVQKNVNEVREKLAKFHRSRPLFANAHSLVEYVRELRRKADLKSRDAADCTCVESVRTLETAIETLQRSLAGALERTLDVLHSMWAEWPNRLRDSTSDDSSKAAWALGAKQQACVEEFVALRYVAFVRGALGHLRHVMIFVAISFSLVLISLNIYSFEPHRSLIWSFTAIFVVTGFMVVGVLMQLHRDPIMSRITHTPAHSLDLHFYLRIVAFGAVPLLTLLATNFPSVGRYLISFLGPSLEALK